MPRGTRSGIAATRSVDVPAPDRPMCAAWAQGEGGRVAGRSPGAANLTWRANMSEYPPTQPYPPAPGPQFPPAQQPYGAPPVKNSLATASLVLGIVSLFASLLFVPAVVGVVLGIVGLQRAGRTTPPVGKGKAITGIVLSGVGLLVGIGLVNAIAGGGDAGPDDAATSITQDADAGRSSRPMTQARPRRSPPRSPSRRRPRRPRPRTRSSRRTGRSSRSRRRARASPSSRCLRA